MNRVIRPEVFETNSSSTHSFGIDDSETPKWQEWKPTNGKVSVYSGEFGWEVADYSDPQSLAAYVFTYAMNHVGEDKKEMYLEMISHVIKARTGAEEVVFEKEEGDIYEFGYIDHQSYEDGQIEPIFYSKDTLARFIFGEESWLHTDNDNH
jgi:hypothetical protein